MEQITYDKLLITVCVVLVLIGAYNTIMTAVKNHREESKRRNQPTATLEETVGKHEMMLANDKRRLDRLEADLEEVKVGQMYTTQGIQALLDHELHNGNSKQMQDASDSIGKWLIGKIVDGGGK